MAVLLDNWTVFSGGHGPPAAASRVPITALQFLQIDTKCRPRVKHSAAAAYQDPAGVRRLEMGNINVRNVPDFHECAHFLLGWDTGGGG